MYKGIEVNDTEGKTRADSSVVGVSMVGVDARYSMKGFELRGQYYLVGLSNTGPYNQFTASEEGPNDLGSRMSGYYLEAGYNVFRLLRGVGTELVPFVRFEQYDTHAAVEDGITWNEGYNNTIITTGLSWRMAPGAVLKADMQFVKPQSADNYSQVFSAGLGFMF
jgi:hypothetical protein